MEEAYEKIENKETTFKSVDDDALIWDIRIDLLKLDATRAMKVPRRINGKKKDITETITAGKEYFILHFAEFGNMFEEDKVKKIFSGIKLSEFHLNPYLVDKQFGLVCDDQERTQHYINSVVDFKNYRGLLKEEENRLEKALNEMFAIANAHIPYEQENNNPPDYKRTAETDEALAKMDCSEFVSRYLKALGLFDEVPYFHTGEMASKEFKQDYSNKLEFVEGSEESDFIDIQPGDIFLWRDNKRSPPTGHTGVVKSFDSITGNVEILEALVWSGGENDDICKNCTRLSKYKYDSGTLNQHKGWIGYFRPLVD